MKMKISLASVAIFLIIKLSHTSDDKPKTDTGENPLKSIELEVHRFASLFEEYLVQESHARKKFKPSESKTEEDEKKEYRHTHPKKKAKDEYYKSLDKQDKKDKQDEIFDFSIFTKSIPNKEDKEQEKEGCKKVYSVKPGYEFDRYRSDKHAKRAAKMRKTRSIVRVGAHRKRRSEEDSSSEERIPRKTRNKGPQLIMEDKPSTKEDDSDPVEDTDEEVKELTENLSKAKIEEDKNLEKRKSRSNSEDRYDKKIIEEHEDSKKEHEPKEQPKTITDSFVKLKND